MDLLPHRINIMKTILQIMFINNQVVSHYNSSDDINYTSYGHGSV